MVDCIFCKIIKKQISANIIYENRQVIAFLDTRPLNPGHVLVIPKKPYRWVWDIKNIGKYYEAVSKVAQAMKQALDTEYIVSLVFGEEISHAHTWLVPRYENDGHGGAIDLKNIKQIDEKDLKIITEKIRKNISH